MSNTFSPASDLTAKQKPSGAGHGDHRLLYVKCGCKSVSTGGLFKSRVPWLCAECREPKK